MGKYEPCVHETIGRLTALLGRIMMLAIGLLLLMLPLERAAASEDRVDSATLTYLAGHWYVRKAEPTTYYYKGVNRAQRQHGHDSN